MDDQPRPPLWSVMKRTRYSYMKQRILVSQETSKYVHGIYPRIDSTPPRSIPPFQHWKDSLQTKTHAIVPPLLPEPRNLKILQRPRATRPTFLPLVPWIGPSYPSSSLGRRQASASATTLPTPTSTDVPLTISIPSPTTQSLSPTIRPLFPRRMSRSSSSSSSTNELPTPPSTSPPLIPLNPSPTPFRTRDPVLAPPLSPGELSDIEDIIILDDDLSPRTSTSSPSANNPSANISSATNSLTTSPVHPVYISQNQFSTWNHLSTTFPLEDLLFSQTLPQPEETPEGTGS